MMSVTFLKDKCEAFGKFKAFRALLEKESGQKIKCLRTDQGGEFVRIPKDIERGGESVSNQYVNFIVL